MDTDRIKKRYYRRSLPHIFPPHGTIFFTYCLDGALPDKIVERLRLERENQIAALRKQHLDPHMIRKRLSSISELYFGKYDALIDQCGSGPIYLQIPEIATIVSDSMHFLDRSGKYELICYCIMSNHVHKIVTEIHDHLPHVLQSHKGYTGKLANQVLSRNGRFWQRESFDHVILDEIAMIEKVRYVLNNPVKAGLVDEFQDWPFHYINPSYLWMLE